MLSIVRTATLASLRADREALQTVRQDLDAARTEAATATAAATRTEALAQQQLRELAKAHADLIQAARDIDAARRERDGAKAAAREEAQEQLAQIRTEVERLRQDAADPAGGDSFRGMLAYRILQRVFEEARETGLQARPPFDLAAIVLGFPTADAAATTERGLR